MLITPAEGGAAADPPEPDEEAEGLSADDSQRAGQIGEDGPAKEATGAQVRLLEVHQDGVVILERPGVSAGAAWVQPGAWVALYLCHGPSRWSASARVAELTRHALRDRVTVGALRLEPPVEVVSEQRRAHYRVDTSMMDLPPVILRLLDEHGRVVNADSTPGLEARLMNLSGGGFGLLLNPRHQPARQVMRGRFYQCRIRLPLVHDEPLTVNARLIHVYPQKGGSVYLGFACQHPDQAAAETFARHATELEREVLRRRRTGV